MLSAHLASWSLPGAVSRAVVLDQAGRILVLGGLETGDTSSGTVMELYPLSGTTVVAGSLAQPVHDAAGAMLEGRALVFGGGSYTSVATVQAWTSAGATVVGSLPTSRSDLAAAVVGRTAYILGGFDGSHLQGAILATGDGTHFRVVGALAVPVRYPAVAVDRSGRIWVAGGELGASESEDVAGATNDIQRFDPATGASSVVGHLPEALAHGAGLFLNDQVLVAGGRTSNGPSAKIWSIDPESAAVSLAGVLPGPRSDAGSIVVDGSAYLVGGEVSGPAAPLSSVVVLKFR